MDIYEFAERDDQAEINRRNKLKSKKRKIKNAESNTKRKKVRKNKQDLVNSNDKEIDKPPIKLKIIRDNNDPSSYKSITLMKSNELSENCNDELLRKSVLKFKLTDNREFQINDIIWNQMSDFEYWPVKIVNATVPLDLEMSDKFSCEDVILTIESILFHEISCVTSANISHFLSDYDSKFDSSNTNNKYIQAVFEAKQLCDEEMSDCSNTRLNYNKTKTRLTPNSAYSSNSVHSCETSYEADTSSGTLPSHNFTSPQSNASIQSSSYCLNPKPNTISCISDPLSNQSSNNLDNNNPSTSFTASHQQQYQSTSIVGKTEDLLNTDLLLMRLQTSAQTNENFYESCKLSLTNSISPNNNNNNNNISTSNNNNLTSLNISWELPDLGSNLFLEEDNHHIPEFSDSDNDEAPLFDINKIDSLVNKI